MTYQATQFFVANDNPNYKQEFRQRLRDMYDLVLKNGVDDEIVQISLEEAERANQVWGLMNGPDGAA